ncbi:hypothetical protein HPG69_000193 [Diceros bicornis minor]|uniref:Uncharacterized protein n=1 Tax=Diceros bicornis minor TaxID=77932 RepID=A0A7J7EV70_DICBM|nr:hypothetical protein HPG69_000193 [Diceros bicornis minor]
MAAAAPQQGRRAGPALRARHRSLPPSKAGSVPAQSQLFRNNPAPESDGKKGCLCPAAFGDLSALEEGLLKPGARLEGEGLFLVSPGHLSPERPAEDQTMLLYDSSSCLLPKGLSVFSAV